MGFQMPARDLHQRHLDTGLTRYSYEEIAAAVAEYEAAERDFLALGDESGRLAEPYDAKYPFWELHAPAHVQALILTDPNAVPAIGLDCNNRGSSEMFPVKRWLAQAASVRACNRKTKRAIEAFKAADAAYRASQTQAVCA